MLFRSCSSVSKESACNAGDLGQEDPLEKGMAIHSSILAWRIPRGGEEAWPEPRTGSRRSRPAALAAVISAHLSPSAGVGVSAPRGTGAPLPTPQMRSLRIQEGGVPGQAQPQGPPSGDQGHARQASQPPVDPGKGVWLAKPSPRDPRAPWTLSLALSQTVEALWWGGKWAGSQDKGDSVTFLSFTERRIKA